jgi:hypothetical protein
MEVEHAYDAVRISVVGKDEQAQEAWRALLRATQADPHIFRVGQELRLLNCAGGTPRLGELTVYSLAALMSRHVKFYKVRLSKESDGDPEFYPTEPPVEFFRLALSDSVTATQDIPEIRQIAEVPVLAPSGRIIRKAGYDRESGIYLAPGELGEVRINERPSRADLEAALGTIGEVICDFPFESVADRTHAIALLLEQLVRPAIDGPTPLYVIESALPGTGKDLLADAICTITTGRTASKGHVPKDEAEMAKQIGAALLAGESMYYMGNSSSMLTLDLPTLANALTCRTWSGRKLGRSEMVSGEIRWSWVLTGNNPHVSQELTRRCVRIRLNAQLEAPEDRPAEEFRHYPLLDWVREHRAEILSAAWTLITYWLLTGSKPGGTPFASFENWARMLGGILHGSGCAGFLANRRKFAEASDRERREWKEFAAAWWEKLGDVPVHAGDLAALLDDCLPMPTQGLDSRGLARELGRLLSTKVDAIYDGYAFRRERDRVQKQWLWRLEKVDG